MCVVVMAMVGWMGAGMELVLGRHAGQSQVVARMSGDAGAFPECVGNTLITPDRTTIQVRSSGYGRAGIGRSSWKCLTRDATRRLRFVVHAAGWLHSMVLHGRCNYCCVMLAPRVSTSGGSILGRSDSSKLASPVDTYS